MNPSMKWFSKSLLCQPGCKFKGQLMRIYLFIVFFKFHDRWFAFDWIEKFSIVCVCRKKRELFGRSSPRVKVLWNGMIIVEQFIIELKKKKMWYSIGILLFSLFFRFLRFKSVCLSKRTQSNIGFISIPKQGRIKPWEKVVWNCLLIGAIVTVF